jgi:hypothetical protein
MCGGLKLFPNPMFDSALLPSLDILRDCVPVHRVANLEKFEASFNQFF